MKTKQKNDYVEYLRTEVNIKYLSQKYRKAHEWIPRLASEAPGIAPEEALKKARDRLTELRSTRKRLKESRRSEHIEQTRQKSDLRRSLPVRAMPHKEMSFVSSAGSPGSIELAYPRPIEHYFIEHTVNSPWENGRDWFWQDRVIDGIARASDYREYLWAPPDNDDTDESHLFLPYGASE